MSSLDKYKRKRDATKTRLKRQYRGSVDAESRFIQMIEQLWQDRIIEHQINGIPEPIRKTYQEVKWMLEYDRAVETIEMGKEKRKRLANPGLGSEARKQLRRELNLLEEEVKYNIHYHIMRIGDIQKEMEVQERAIVTHEANLDALVGKESEEKEKRANAIQNKIEFRGKLCNKIKLERIIAYQRFTKAHGKAAEIFKTQLTNKEETKTELARPYIATTCLWLQLFGNEMFEKHTWHPHIATMLASHLASELRELVPESDDKKFAMAVEQLPESLLVKDESRYFSLAIYSAQDMFECIREASEMRSKGQTVNEKGITLEACLESAKKTKEIIPNQIPGQLSYLEIVMGEPTIEGVSEKLDAFESKPLLYAVHAHLAILHYVMHCDTGAKKFRVTFNSLKRLAPIMEDDYRERVMESKAALKEYETAIVETVMNCNSSVQDMETIFRYAHRGAGNNAYLADIFYKKAIDASIAANKMEFEYLSRGKRLEHWDAHRTTMMKLAESAEGDEQISYVKEIIEADLMISELKSETTECFSRIYFATGTNPEIGLGVRTWDEFHRLSSVPPRYVGEIAPQTLSPTRPESDPGK